MIVLGLVLAVPVVLALSLIPSTVPEIVPFLVVGAAAVCGSLFHLRWRARHRFRDRRALALGAQRCPACWYDLAESLIEADRCVVCPECGAAWRVEDGGRKGK